MIEGAPLKSASKHEILLEHHLPCDETVDVDHAFLANPVSPVHGLDVEEIRLKKIK